MNMNKLYFVYNKDELLIKTENGNISLPNEDDIKALNLTLSNVDFLTSKDTQEFLFGEIHEITTLAPPFHFSKLRSLLGLADKSLFDSACKAFHLINWNNTYKYCSKCG